MRPRPGCDLDTIVRGRRRLAGAIGVAATLTFPGLVIATPLAPAECYVCGPKPYRMVVLGTIGSASTLRLPPFGDLSFGINNEGQAVFFAPETPGVGSSDIHLYVYLPRAVFNLAPGVHDLHPWLDPAPPSGFDDTVGTDINNAGKIVGLAGGSINPNSGVPAEAWLFELDQTTLSGSTPQVPNESLHPTSLTVGEQAESTGCYSVAHGISNSSPPAVAGAAALELCSFECDGSNPIIGFTHELGGAYIAREASGTSRNAFAYALNDASPRRVVGADANTYSPDICTQNPEVVLECESFNNPNDGLFWSGASTAATEFVELGFSSGNRGATQARDVHSDSSAVGVSAVVFETSCRPRAVWWSAGNVATDLNSVYAEEDNSTRAEAIRDIGGTANLRVVGGDEDNFDGLLWLRISDVWCADTFDDIAMNPAGSMQSDDYEITFAHDVNTHGHVITHGFVPGGGFQRAILLTCAADYTGDYLVDGADLAILLSVLPCTGCSEDLNGDGVVDSGDLGLLLGMWQSWDPEDPWVPCAIALPPSCEESQSSSAPALTLSEAIVALGFEDVAALKEWAASATPTQINTVGAALAVLIGGS